MRLAARGGAECPRGAERDIAEPRVKANLAEISYPPGPVIAAGPVAAEYLHICRPGRTSTTQKIGRLRSS